MARRRSFKCVLCRKRFQRRWNCTLHERLCENINSAIGGNVSEIKMKTRKQRSTNLDPLSALLFNASAISKSIKRFFRNNGALKFYITISIIFQITVGGKTILTDPPATFRAKSPKIVLRSSVIDEEVEDSLWSIDKQISEYQTQGSGWTFKKIEDILVTCVRFKSLSPSSFIKTPSALARRKALINVKNETDSQCFKWAVLSALFHRNIVGSKNRVGNYKRMRHDIVFDGTEFPVKLSKIANFEAKNPTVKVNIFGYDKGGQIFPLRLSNASPADGTRVVDLLLLEKADTSHYVAITNLQRLVSSQIRTANNTRHICRRCLCSFFKRKSLRKHQLACMQHKMTAIQLPSEEEKILKFKNFVKKMPVPFYIVADFECLLVKRKSNSK